MLRFPERIGDDVALNYKDDFSLQSYLSEMREEAKEARIETNDNIIRLGSKVDREFKDMHILAGSISSELRTHELAETQKFENHDGRIKTLERLHGEYKWFIKTCIVAVIGAAIKYILGI